MHDLIPLAERAGALLQRRGETVAVAESSAGGLVNAALLAVPGASGWCRGGAVLYTRHALTALRDVDRLPPGVRPSTEGYALFTARTLRDRLGASWGLAETGAAGPTGNRYGDAAGHACLAVAGAVERTRTIETGSAARYDNMLAFAAAALVLLIETLDAR